MLLESVWLVSGNFSDVLRADPVWLLELVAIEMAANYERKTEEIWQIYFYYEKQINYDQIGDFLL